MASFFISHSSKDRAIAQRVRQWLRRRGHLDLFLSTEPGFDIPASADWQRELWLQVRSKRFVVFLSSRASIASRWCFAELALARALNRRVFALDLGGGSHPLLGGVQVIKAAHDLPGALKRLALDFERLGLDRETELEWDPSRDPYPGLGSFHENDAGVFFGRGEETTALMRELDPPNLDPRPSCVPVVGASGSGKSSLVLAGLVPQLRRQPEWVIAGPFAPGTRPTLALATALGQAGATGDTGRLHERILSTPETLGRDVAAIFRASKRLIDTARLLVVIDQLEEAFTLSSGHEQRAFFAAIKALTGDVPWKVVVCATLRSEFLRHALEHQTIATLFRRTFPVTRLDAARLRDVVVRPAERAAITVEPELVERILADTSGPDALPLLSYTLQLVWQRCRADRVMTRAAYDALGGVTGTLRAQADLALAELVAAGFSHAEVLGALLQLVTVEPGAEATGRPVLAAGMGERATAVIGRFTDPARLLVKDGDSVRVAHEALLRAWPPLVTAIGAVRDELEAISDLRQGAFAWDQSGRQPGRLLAAERLDAGRRWRARVAAGTASPDSLLDALVAASEQHVAAELAWRSEQLARRVLAELDDDPERGVLLALAAIDEYAATDVALRALHDADRAWRGCVRLHDPKWLRAAWFLRDESILTVSSVGAIRRWQATTGAAIDEIRPENVEFMFVNDVTISRDRSTLAIALGTAERGCVEVWDVPSATRAWKIDLEEPPRAIGVSSDGRFVAIGSSKQLVVHDRISNDRRVHAVTSVASVAVSSDGRILAAGGFRTLVWINDLLIQPLEQLQKDDVKFIQFSAEERCFVRAALDGTVALYTRSPADQPQVTPTKTLLAEGLGWVFTSAFSPDDKTILVLGDRPEMGIIDHATLARRVPVVRRGIGRSGDLHHAGERVVTVGDTTLTTWDVRPDRAVIAELHAHEDFPMWGGSFCAERRLLIERDGKLRCVGFDGREAWSVPVKAMLGDWAVDPRGRFVAVTADDGIILIDFASGDVVGTIRDKGDTNWGNLGFAPNGDEIWAANSDGAFARWTLPGRTPIVRLTLKVKDFMFRAAVGGDLVVASAKGLYAFDWKTGEPRWQATLKGSSHAPSFSPDGARIAVSSESTTISIFDTASGAPRGGIEYSEKLNPRSAYAPSFNGVRWSPDGTRLAVAGSDGTASVWNADTLGLLQAFVTTKDPLEDITWSSDGERLLAVGRERAVVWDAPSPVVLVARARTRCWRALDQNERFRYGLRPHPIHSEPDTGVGN